MRIYFRFLLMTSYYYLLAPPPSVLCVPLSTGHHIQSAVGLETVDRDAFQTGYADPEQQAQPVRQQAWRRAQIPQTRAGEVPRRTLSYRPFRLRCLWLG